MSDKIIVLSPEDSALDAFCIGHGTRLYLLDETLSGMADDTPGKHEIERRLSRLRKSCSAGNLDAAEAWLYAVVDGIKAIGTWLPKTKGKIASEKALKDAQPAGTAATKAAAKRRQDKLELAVKAQPKWKPKQFGGMADDLGMSEEVIIKKVRAIQRKTKSG